MSLHEQFEILKNKKEGSLEYEMALADVTIAVFDMERMILSVEKRVKQFSNRIDSLEAKNSHKALPKRYR